MPISIPKFFQRAFAQNGGKQDVPITGDTSGGRASYDVGFPPVTRIPIVAGGIPPFGTDFNGVLYDLSKAIQYVQSGVAFPFNQDFATAIGGYEIGAIVSDASDKSLLWVNGTANNTAFPSGWASFKYSDPSETLRGLPLVATASEVLARSAVLKLTPPNLAPRLLRIVSITSSGTYTKPADVGSILVYACGGGGGGGGCPETGAGYSSVGGPGSGGSTAVKFISSPASSYSVAIGQAGAGGISGSQGASGGSTSFGGVCIGTGGGYGLAGTLLNSPRNGSAGVEPISGSIGDMVHLGSSGSLGFCSANYAMSSVGGDSLFSSRTNYVDLTNTSGSVGAVGVGYGGGGGGGLAVNTGTVVNGGAGYQGIVYVWEFA